MVAQEQRVVCKKCNSDGEIKGSYFTEAGEAFYFCKICSEVLEHMPQGNKVGCLLKAEDYSFIKNRILKDLISARMRRKNGKKLWE